MANKNQYSVQDDPNADLVERFSVLHDQYTELTDKYSQLAKVNEANMAEYARMRTAVVQLEQRAVDADRTMRIKDLYQQYPHFVELDKELDTCLYSHGGDMGAEAFDKHVEWLETYAKKSSPVTQMLPGGQVTDNASKELYTEDFSNRVVERYTQLANKGHVHTFAEVEQMLKEGK